MQAFTKILFLISALIFPFLSFAQPITLDNPSFEGIPRGSTTPAGWYDCGFAGESPPDTHPSGAFDVTTTAKDGMTYLGMVTRGNDTYEMVGQLLDQPLKGGQCYEFQIYLARSARYWSASNWSQSYENYIDPIVLRVWGGNSYCDKKERLVETDVIEHTDWKLYTFKLNPRRDLRYIGLEVYYKVPTLFAYNGNVLLDNASAIIPCGEEFPEEVEEPVEEVIVNVSPRKNDPPAKPDPPVVTPPEADEPVTTPEDSEKINIPELDRKTIVEGQIIRVNNLFFAADTFNLDEDNFPVLDEIYDFLSENKDVTIEIGGHTNGLPPHPYCDRLSQNRAESVVMYLIHKGIPGERIYAKGYGKRKPIESNRTLEGRQKNQRVEITILSIGRK